MPKEASREAATEAGGLRTRSYSSEFWRPKSPRETAGHTLAALMHRVKHKLHKLGKGKTRAAPLGAGSSTDALPIMTDALPIMTRIRSKTRLDGNFRMHAPPLLPFAKESYSDALQVALEALDSAEGVAALRSALAQAESLTLSFLEAAYAMPSFEPVTGEKDPMPSHGAERAAASSHGAWRHSAHCWSRRWWRRPRGCGAKRRGWPRKRQLRPMLTARFLT